ncbi:MAG: DUF4383 domain-containing protein [Chloroflexi bacterium]|nr:DUF4383 domain-containing protein [Chloroflexota bacterium]
MIQNRETTLVQYGMWLIGVVYVALGVAGFLPIDFINPVHHDGIGARYLVNLVAINALHNIIHLAIGLPALWAARSFANAQLWGKIAGAVLLLLFVAGMIQAFLEGFPIDQSFLGLVPLNSPGHILHLTSGAIALYLGLMRPSS